MAKIQILVGSVSGTALKTALAVSHVLNHQGHDVRVNDEPVVADLVDSTDETILVCCSTTGAGELPPSLIHIYNALDDRAVDLSGRYYGVIALGDSKYAQFAQAGLLMESVLYMAGGKRIGDICTLDAQKVSNHPLSAAQWANEWVEQVDHCSVH